MRFRVVPIGGGGAEIDDLLMTFPPSCLGP